LVLLGCDAISLGEWFPVCLRYVLCARNQCAHPCTHLFLYLCGSRRPVASSTLVVSAAELFKGQRQHSKNNEFKSPYQNLQKPEPLLWQIWCQYGHSSNQDTVHEQAESLTSYDTRQPHRYTRVCPYEQMGLRNHVHTHACWMLLNARQPKIP